MTFFLHHSNLLKCPRNGGKLAVSLSAQNRTCCTFVRDGVTIHNGGNKTEINEYVLQRYPNHGNLYIFVECSQKMLKLGLVYVSTNVFCFLHLLLGQPQLAVSANCNTLQLLFFHYSLSEVHHCHFDLAAFNWLCQNDSI